MASKQTEYYQLCLWEPEDNFQRTEFNGDNQKIDEALAGLAARTTYVPLLEVTTAAQVSQVNLDVSGIDFTAWKTVQLICDQETSVGGGSDAQIYVRLNGRTDTVYCDYTINGYNSISINQRSYLVKAETFGSLARRQIRVDFFSATAGALRAELDDLLLPVGQTYFYHSRHTGFTNAVTPASLTQINLTGTVPAGTRLSLWGVN